MPPAIRLVGDFPGTPGGRVEVCSDTGDWLTVCDVGWDSDDAQVACTNLGFPNSAG